MTLIAQISDVHLGFERAAARDRNAERLDAVLAAVRDCRPDAIVLTGDLTEFGEVARYRQLAQALRGVDCPVHLMLGNHDLRENFASVFADTPRDPDGFVQYAIELGGLRCIILDTQTEGRHSGGFCDRRAAWLAATLAAAPDTPTLLLLHHPPAPVGIAWMDPGVDEPWIARLAGAVAGHGQIVGLATGHVHRACATRWQGLPLTIAPSVAPGLALNLDPIDPEQPDDRAMIVDSIPGFALHRWDGTRLTTHFASVEPPVLARFTSGLQPMVRALAAERRA